MSKKVQPSDVRGRVERHLRRLLIPGVMGLGACRSTKVDSVVCDPMPAPVDANAGAAPDAEAPPSVVCDPMPAPPPSRDRPSRPPVVCDPMPPPPPRDK